MRALSSDPLRNFRFGVTIIPAQDSVGMSPNLSLISFMTVSGLGVQNEVIPYREGGDNSTTRKLPGQTDFGPITLGRGMMAAPLGTNGVGTNEIYNWLSEVFSVLEGGGTNDGKSDFRADVMIDVYQHPITMNPGNGPSGSAAGASAFSGWIPPIRARHHVYNAWPMALSWSDLDAGGNAVIIETLQLAHEGFHTVYAPNGAGQETQYLKTSQQ